MRPEASGSGVARASRLSQARITRRSVALKRIGDIYTIISGTSEFPGGR